MKKTENLYELKVTPVPKTARVDAFLKLMQDLLQALQEEQERENLKTTSHEKHNINSSTPGDPGQG